MTKILIIYTGGTIGMVNDPQTGTLMPFDFKQIQQNVPEMTRLNYHLEVHSFDPILDSSNMDPEVWGMLARIIESRYAEFDGFVILHGSDTMAYTASALSFMLENLAKPVVLNRLAVAYRRNQDRCQGKPDHCSGNCRHQETW